MIIAIGLILVMCIVVVALWVNGIDYMHKNHPDYKGEEFLNWDRKHDDWDDNKVHTEHGI